MAVTRIAVHLLATLAVSALALVGAASALALVGAASALALVEAASALALVEAASVVSQPSSVPRGQWRPSSLAATNHLGQAPAPALEAEGFTRPGQLGTAAHQHTSSTRTKRQDHGLQLPTPTDLRVTSASLDSVSLQWKYDGQETGVEFLVNVYYSGGTFAKDQVARGTSVKVDGLAPSTSYRLSVKASKPLPGGRRAQSADSNSVTASTQETVLPRPASLRVTAEHQDSIDLAWQYDGQETGVEFLVNVYYSGGTFAKDQVARGTSVKVDGLAPSTSYRLSVKASKPLPGGRRAQSADSNTVTASTHVTRPVTRPPVPPPVTRPVTPPPVTRPAEPPPAPSLVTSQPPSPVPDTACSGEGQCWCPPPHQDVCVPCTSLTTCNKTGGAAVCSTEPAAASVKQSVSVLSCGQASLNVEGILRGSARGVPCGSDGGVPARTVAMVECWGTATLLVQCHPDGTWHPYGRHQGQAPSSRHLCQFDTINSPVCGRRARYHSQATVLGRPMARWPWLVGLILQQRYACTATIITPTFLLTAAHCLTRTQETSEETVDLRELRVQHLDHQGQVVSRFVRSVQPFPGFLAGGRPSHDVALLRLEQPITFSHEVYPACLHIHTQGLPSHAIAATFNRTASQYKWELFLQQYDPRCHSPHDPCGASINLEKDQFCATDIDSERALGAGASGGPYLVNVGSEAQERWAVAGLVSTSYSHTACATPLTICTTVADFWPWISRCVHHGNCSGS